MANRTVVAILSVPEELLDGENSEESFESEMGWAEESGIYLRDWTDAEEAEVAFVNGEHCLCC